MLIAPYTNFYLSSCPDASRTGLYLIHRDEVSCAGPPAAHADTIAIASRGISGFSNSALLTCRAGMGTIFDADAADVMGAEGFGVRCM